MLIYVRPSNEALLRARVPGAQGQRGCPSNPFHRGGSASKKGTWPLPTPQQHPPPGNCNRCSSSRRIVVCSLPGEPPPAITTTSLLVKGRFKTT